MYSIFSRLVSFVLLFHTHANGTGYFSYVIYIWNQRRRRRQRHTTHMRRRPRNEMKWKKTNTHTHTHCQPTLDMRGRTLRRYLIFLSLCVCVVSFFHAIEFRRAKLFISSSATYVNLSFHFRSHETSTFVLRSALSKALRLVMFCSFRLDFHFILHGKDVDFCTHIGVHPRSFGKRDFNFFLGFSVFSWFLVRLYSNLCSFYGNVCNRLFWRVKNTTEERKSNVTDNKNGFSALYNLHDQWFGAPLFRCTAL